MNRARNLFAVSVVLLWSIFGFAKTGQPQESADAGRAFAQIGPALVKGNFHQ
jgi:hypothetical protein